MKISKIYTNKPEIFSPIEFVSGLNVVIAEIRVPENKNRDTHNLGKTTLGKLLDFSFLNGRDPEFFLFKKLDLFKEFIFFLEIELLDGSFLTIRRSVAEASKISFKKHEAAHQDFTNLKESDWDHVDIAFDKAQEILDGLLDWRSINPWPYRKGMGYLLRTQEDYGDVFQLKKFAAAHSDWKPFLAHILGFNSNLIKQHYAKEDELEKKQETEHTIKNELGGSVEDISKLEGILLIKQQEADKKQRLLDAFDFRAEDKNHTKKLIDEIDQRLGALNTERYSLSQNRGKIVHSLGDGQILFDPDEAETLFAEAGVIFQGQIKKDFEQLIAFNRAITDERRGYLKEDLDEIDEELKIINNEINNLGKKRSDFLSFLSDTDFFSKYRQVTNEMVVLRADITSLDKRRSFMKRLQELRTEIRSYNEELTHLQSQIEDDVERQNSDPKSLFSTIRAYFNEIVEEVIDRKAVLSVSPNRQGHLEFSVEIFDKTGNVTMAGDGHTYRKLLCIAFDLAVLRAHLNDKFPRFVYHDGVFESLDDRKKSNLLVVLRNYADLGIQTIITLIDSDMPPTDQGSVFADDEIILKLHDEDESGRLFKMPSW